MDSVRNDRSGIQSNPTPVTPLQTAQCQKTFFDQLKNCAEDTVESREKLKNTLEKMAIQNPASSIFLKDRSKCRLMSSEFKKALMDALDSKVSRSFWSVFSAPRSVFETVFKKMNLQNQREFLKCDGFEFPESQDKRGVEDPSFILDQMIKFIIDRGSKFDLGESRLKALPNCLLNNNLRELDCKGCRNLQKIVPPKGQCINLEKVDFTNSAISEFNFRELSKLKKMKVTFSYFKEDDLLIRKAFVNSLPLNREVAVEGFVNGLENWPHAGFVTVRDLGNGKVGVTVHGYVGDSS